MAERGYDFVALDAPDRRVRRTDPTEWVFPPSPEFRSEIGYGWTVDDARGFVASERQIRDVKAQLGGNQSAVNLYYEAQSECYEDASQAIASQGELAAGEEMEIRVEEAFDRFFSDLASEPQIVEAEAAWVSCMSEKGYPGETSPQEFRLRIAEELGARVFETLSSSTDVVLNGTDDDLMASVSRIKAEEVRAAEADASCQSGTTLPLEELYRDTAEAVFGDLSPAS